jgi:hypothetical protein
MADDGSSGDAPGSGSGAGASVISVWGPHRVPPRRGGTLSGHLLEVTDSLSAMRGHRA